MGIESGVVAAITLGFFLGLKHATDADHVVAISTITSEDRNAWRGIWVGCSWGLGHSVPLFVLGIIILIFKDTVLNQYQAITPMLEFGIGVMLIFLGVQVLWNLRRSRLHLHEHSHDDGPHVHIHATHDPNASADVEVPHGFFQPGRPFFRMKSFVIGTAHGLAGSAAVMLVLIPKFSSPWIAVGYLLLFSLGTILSMSAITLLLGVSFAISGGFHRLNRIVSGVAGTTSTIFGIALISDIVLHTSLITF